MEAANKVSEWVAQGGMASGTYLIENSVERETDKAVAFKAEKYNSFGNLKPALCWVPKSKLTPVVNDFYVNARAGLMYLMPHWLYSAKSDEGFVL